MCLIGYSEYTGYPPEWNACRVYPNRNRDRYRNRHATRSENRKWDACGLSAAPEEWPTAGRRASISIPIAIPISILPKPRCTQSIPVPPVLGVFSRGTAW